MPSYSFRKKLIFTLIPMSMLVFATLLTAEVFVRVYSNSGYVTPELLRRMSPQYEPSVFSRPVFPERQQTVLRKEHEVPLYINELGYRGHNFSIKKPDGAVRIIIYGGSGVFDAPMPEGKDWPHRVEHM